MMEALSHPNRRARQMALISAVLCLLVASPAAAASTIHQAAGKGDLALLKTLLKASPTSVNAKDARDVTPLHIAAYYGKLQAAEALIAANAVVDARSKNGNSPLHWAAWRKHSDIAKVLIDAGADVNAVTKAGRSPLHFAAENGDVGLLRLLLEKGAKRDVADLRGKRPLDLARTTKDTLVIEILSEPESPTVQPPQPDAPLELPGEPPNTLNPAPPMPAVLPKPEDQQGTAARPGEPLVVITEETSPRTKARRGPGSSRAVASRSTRKTVAVPKQPAVLAANQGEAKPLRSLTPAAKPDTKPVTTARLLDKKPPVRGPEPTPKVQQTTPKPPPPAVVASLPTNESRPSQPKRLARPSSAKDLSRVIDAALSHDLGTIRKIIAASPGVMSARDRKGATPLHWAAQSGDESIAALLIRAGADVNARKRDGVTPLHVAAALGKDDIVRLLVSSKADIRAVDSKGRTPLALTRERGQPDTEQLLLDLGAGE